MENLSIGTDIEDNRRFENKTLENDEKFLRKIFTGEELDYSFSKLHPEQHLCARFCAKEAVIKALSGINITNVHYSDIDIYHSDNGSVHAKISKYPDLNIKLSISHCTEYSVAFVLIC